MSLKEIALDMMDDEIAVEHNSDTDGKDIVKRIVPPVVSTTKKDIVLGMMDNNIEEYCTYT
jgi:hypothetical protein